MQMGMGTGGVTPPLGSTPCQRHAGTQGGPAQGLCSSAPSHSQAEQFVAYFSLSRCKASIWKQRVN